MTFWEIFGSVMSPMELQITDTDGEGNMLSVYTHTSQKHL